MISRLSGRPERPPGETGQAAPLRKDQAAEIIRRFFHALERLDRQALRGLAEAVAAGEAPEIKAGPARPRSRRRRPRQGDAE